MYFLPDEKGFSFKFQERFKIIVISIDDCRLSWFPVVSLGALCDNIVSFFTVVASLLMKRLQHSECGIEIYLSISVIAAFLRQFYKTA